MWILIVLLFPAVLVAQEFNFVFEPDSIPVTIDGWQPYSPWSGGEEESSPDFCDIDADGDLDLFVGNYWGKITHYLNVGTALHPDYQFITRDFADVDLGGVIYVGRTCPEFSDLDGDGDYDLFTSDGRGLIHYWENVGNAEMYSFAFVTDSLEYIDVAGFADIALIDIDHDDDFDLFIGDYYGHIIYYRNEGDSHEWDFVLVTEQFDGIDVGYYADPCFIDIDDDLDFDLFIGDKYGNINYYRNDGDSVNYDFTFVTDFYDSIDVGDYSSPEFADVDGDGDYDLFVGSEYSTSGSRVGDIYYYENIGSPFIDDYQFRTKNYISLDVGANLKPQFVDINNDGCIDFIAGSYNNMIYYQNAGTSSSPSFVFVEEYFQGIVNNGLKPCFVDIDADGDYDLLAGESAIPGPPEIMLYVNRGTPESPDFILFNENYVSNPNFSVNIYPGCADIDADGDYDLFISDDDGYFYYYQNDGDSLCPEYTYITDQWQGIFFNLDQYWRQFCFSDLDGDGDLDLLMTNNWNDDYGNLRYYENTGNANQANMDLVTNVFIPSYELYTAYPSLSDIDDDGDLDIFTGDICGGIWFFRNHADSTGVADHYNNNPYTFTLYPNYPNPFNAQTVIPFTLDRTLPVRIAVYNQLGQEVVTLVDQKMNPGMHQIGWDAGTVSSGVYLIQLETPEYSRSQKATLVK